MELGGGLCSRAMTCKVSETSLPDGEHDQQLNEVLVQYSLMFLIKPLSSLIQELSSSLVDLSTVVIIVMIASRIT